MKISALGLIISLAGVIFFSVCLLLVLLGKKVGERGAQSVKVGEYVNVRTNSVLMLVIISAAVLLTPIALAYWKPDLSDYVHKSTLTADYLHIAELSVSVYGAVLLEGGIPANDVAIEVIRSYAESLDTLRTTSDEQGCFNIKLASPRPNERYRITWTKAGYGQRRLQFGFNEIPQTLVLKLGDEG